MAEETNYTLTSGDISALQKARKHIEGVKRAIYTGHRGTDWHEPMRHTFAALSVAEELLMAVVVGSHDQTPEAREQYVATHIRTAIDLLTQQLNQK